MAPSENVPVQKQFQATVGEKFPSGEDTVTSSTQPKLSVLSGDKYDRPEFNVLNDSEFTELLSSIEGIGVSEFFTLYEELKGDILEGTLDIGFSTLGEGNVFSLIEDAIDELRSGNYKGFSGRLDILIKQVGLFTEAFSNATPGTHAYLVQSSSRLVEELNTRFTALFNLLVGLMEENAELKAQLDTLTQENGELKKQVAQLNNLIIKLTSPDSSGFQVVPDIFSVNDSGVNFRAGDTVDVTVNGSTKYFFASDPRYPGMFTWDEYTGNKIRKIKTDPRMAGITSYITVVAEDAPTKTSVLSTEQIVFIFPSVVVEPTSSLSSDVGTDIQLWLPRTSSDIQSFNAQGYKSFITITISGGVGPYTYTNNVLGGNVGGFYKVEGLTNSGNTATVSLRAIRDGNVASALTIRDSVGALVRLNVVVKSIFVPRTAGSIDVSITPRIIVATRVGDIVTAFLTYAIPAPGETVEIIPVGTFAGKSLFYTITRGINPVITGNTMMEEIQFQMTEPGHTDQIIITGGSDIQSFVDDMGHEHKNAIQLEIDFSSFT